MHAATWFVAALHVVRDLQLKKERTDGRRNFVQREGGREGDGRRRMDWSESEGPFPVI